MTAAPRLAGALRLMIAALFAATAALAGLWSLPPLDRDEARFAQATLQMIESGDYVTIRFQDRERNKKPAGVNWLQAASVRALSNVEAREIWAYRIPSVLGVIAAAIFVYLTGLRLFDPRTALLAAILLASAPVVAAEATIAKTDGVLLALICLAQLAFAHIYATLHEGRPGGWRWPLTFWTAQGLSVLIKGPIGPFISLMTGAGLLTSSPRFAWIARMRPISGFLLFVLIIAPWTIAIGLATDGRFFSEAIGGDMFGKLGAAQEHHGGPPGFHFGLVWLLFWPAAALMLGGVALAWRERARWQARFLLSWLIPAWLVFEFAATKLPHYVLPLYPALALISAYAATRDHPLSALTRKSGALIYGGVGLFAAALIAFLPIMFSQAPITPLCFLAAALVACASTLIASLFWRGRAYAGGVAAAVLAALYAWTLMTGVLPGLSKLAVAPRISVTLETLERHPLHDGAAPVALAGYYEPSAVFLLGAPTALTTGGDAARRLAAGEVSAAIVEDRVADGFAETIERNGARVDALVVIDGLNYSNARMVALTIYVLAE